MTQKEFATWNYRQASNKRTNANLTTAPNRLGMGPNSGGVMDSILSSDGTMSIILGSPERMQTHDFQPDLRVFGAKRHTVQPTSALTKELDNLRNPLQMGP